MARDAPALLKSSVPFVGQVGNRRSVSGGLDREATVASAEPVSSSTEVELLSS